MSGPVQPTPAAGPVCVVMAVFNGARFLPEQLASFREQTYPPRWIVVGDDGSTDGSRDILQSFFDAWPECELILLEGPQKGYCANFCKALAHVPAEANWVALSDQDDVWLPSKIERAIARHTSAIHTSTPALYGGRTWQWTATTNERRLSRETVVKLGFEHALAQNFAGGNTMVLNTAAMALVRKALPHAGEVEVHDWWLYQIVTGAGGQVIYDLEPQMLYRQHESNEIGANEGLLAMLRRVRAMLRGTYRGWNTKNFESLDRCSEWLTPSARETLDAVRRGRRKGPVARLTLQTRGFVRRQGVIGRTGLAVSLLLNRF